MKRTGKLGTRAGLTLLEVLIGSMILFLLAGTLTQSLRAMRSTTATGGALVRAQDAGQRALERIRDDLRRSGFVGNYPYLGLVDGVPDDPAFAAHGHVAAPKLAVAGDFDFGPNREIVFVLPADLDNNGEPDVDAAGDLVWSVDEVSYVVVPDANGVNWLERRVNGAGPRRVCRNVERITFEDWWIDNTVPLGDAVRVRIFFREPSENGTRARYSVQAVVRLQNGNG